MNAITEFESKVTHLYEAEYGDFKRKLGLYITRLEQDMGQQLTGQGRIQIDELKHQLIYSPETTNIEQARTMALELAQSLK